MEIKDMLIVGVSVLALTISFWNYLRDRKKSKNGFLRLVVLTQALKNDFDRLAFNYRMLHFIPGKINEDYIGAFNSSKNSLENKIKQFYDLLLLNQNFSEVDMKKVLKSLMELEQNLYDLYYSQIDNFEDLESTRAITNPMDEEMKHIESLINQYDHA